MISISSNEDSYDAACVLAPTCVRPHVLSRAAVFPLLAPVLATWTIRSQNP
jgi:hypothetical protein